MIAICGGAFDPLHFGHLRPLFVLFKKPQIERIILVPCGVSATGKKLAAKKHRLAMLNAVKYPNGISVSACELNREGVSYTVETLAEMRDELGTDVALAFVLGQDAYAELSSWFRFERVLELAHLIVVARPGAAAADELVANFVALSELTRVHNGLLSFFDDCQVEISATQIRHMISKGCEPRQLLPAEVWDYIREHKLYGWRG